MTSNTAVISVRDLVVGFGETPVLDHATLDVFEGEILGFVGGSGAGKSVLMRTIIGLLPKRNGSIEVFGTDLAAINDDERRAIERGWGGLFKRGRRAGRVALDPDIVFLDEPTSGLDPIGAAEFDALIRTLQRTLGLSVFMVTHDLDSLHTVCDRIAVLSEGRIITTGPIETMLASEHPWLKSYFRGKRGRRVHH